MIEGFSEVAGIIMLAKELHDIGRFDVAQNQFHDSLHYDSWPENTWGVITSVFSGFYNEYDDDGETEIMIFDDDLIRDYFIRAREYGIKTKTPYDKNPYVIEAQNEIRKQLNYCYSMDWRLLGYTKTKKTARQSKLIVYIGMCECDSHTKLAYGLIRLYKWFSNKVAEFKMSKEAAA